MQPSEPPGAGFRTATADDVPALVQLVHAAYRGGPELGGWTTESDLLGGQRVDADMLTAALADPDVVVLVLDGEDGHGLLGCCELRRPGPDGAAALGMFAVPPARQGAGLGGRVLAEAERLAHDEWGATTLRLSVIDVRHDLLAWYARRGYRPTGEHQPFPYGDERFGHPRRDDLRFAILAKDLARTGNADLTG